jgi:hypothetical protein
MSTRLSRSTAVMAALALAAFAAVPAHAFRCGSHLIDEGDSVSRVENFCGAPTDVQRRSVMRRPVLWRYGHPIYLSGDALEVPVEIWTYNLGPHKLMRRVKFEDGLVTSIETLGYGYWPTHTSR